jgi:hypothetical protein
LPAAATGSAATTWIVRIGVTGCGGIFMELDEGTSVTGWETSSDPKYTAVTFGAAILTLDRINNRNRRSTTIDR